MQGAPALCSTANGGYRTLADRVGQTVRSRIMASIRGKAARSEMIVCRGPHTRGFRYWQPGWRPLAKLESGVPFDRVVSRLRGCLWHARCCCQYTWSHSKVHLRVRKIMWGRGRDVWSPNHLGVLSWRVLVTWQTELRANRLQDAYGIFNEATSLASVGRSSATWKG